MKFAFIHWFCENSSRVLQVWLCPLSKVFTSPHLCLRKVGTSRSPLSVGEGSKRPRQKRVELGVRFPCIESQTAERLVLWPFRQIHRLPSYLLSTLGAMYPSHINRRRAYFSDRHAQVLCINLFNDLQFEVSCLNLKPRGEKHRFQRQKNLWRLERNLKL